MRVGGDQIESLLLFGWLFDSKVFLGTPHAGCLKPLAIMQGSSCACFRPVSQSEFQRNFRGGCKLFSQGFIPGLIPDGHNILHCGMNVLPEWSLEGGSTFSVQLSQQIADHRFALLEDIQLEAEGDDVWEFTALLACHRAAGELEISCRQGHRQKTHRIRFDGHKTGGRNSAGYQSVKAAIPVQKGMARISLRINHQNYLADELGSVDSYYFIANPSLRSSSGLELEEEEHSEARQLFSSQPPHLCDQLWSANVRPFAAAGDDPLVVAWEDGTCEPLFAPLAIDLELVADYGHSLIVRASEAKRLALYVNGNFVEHVNIESNNTTVQIPPAWLRGEPILVEIRDASGSQIFLSHPLLAPRQLTPADLLLQEIKRPFPTDLTCRANHRYQALRAHLRHPIPGITQDGLLQALETLDADYATLKLKPLRFPEVAEPEVSVVIPAHNKVEATYYALAALLLAHNTTSFEVILVDDGSTDETAEIEELVGGIRVIRNAEPLRFIKACNKGVSEARGTYVVLLNNDTEVTLGWLDVLVDAFQRFDGVGAVGSKLLYPDGTLQDAGGIIWGSGNPWNYGSKQNPWDPRFCYARQVDYLSGAALMTTKSIWDEVGGLSSYLEPMYFEDTDFSFKIREAGYKTYFVPSSVVYHFEGTTSGTDTSSGFKKYQEVNTPKFKRRWAKAFSRHGEEGVNPDLEKDRGISGRILFIDYTIPRQDQDAGSYAAIREIELVQALGYKVTFLPQNLAFFGNYTEELQCMGVEVIIAPFYLSLAAFLEERAKEFDAAYITRYNVAADTVHLIREFSPKTRIVLNNADLHFLRALRAAISEGDEAKLEAMRDIRNQELAMMRSVDLVLSYNEVEHVVISSHTDGAVKVMTCPWVVDIPETVAPLAGRAGLSFLGSFKHHPNAEGVQWFCQEVMPQLEAQQLKLSIYGSGMDDDIKDLASDWIDPVGYVEDVADAYQRHRVFVAPLLSGAGIKGKVLNALAYGIPTVLTPTAAEGIGLRHGHDCLIAKTPEEWVEGITRLCEDEELWALISHAARSYAASQFSFAAGKLKMKAAFETVDLFSHTHE
jgi:GT2 family glycosyltransferase